MSYQYENLKSEYAHLLATMVVTRKNEIEQTANKLISLIPRYRNVEQATGVPALWLAAINERESDSNFMTYLGNGDRLSAPTRHVPAGRGPFPTWEAGAKDALHYDEMDRVADLPGGWTWTRACFEGEAWNGFGPRMHGIHTGYLWAGTGAYSVGKYISDGQWSARTVDTQLGMIPVMKALVDRDATLDLVNDVAEVPETLDDVSALQDALNKLIPGENLTVDGSFGNNTRNAVREFQAAHGLTVDGIAGPKTKAAIAIGLASLPKTA